MKYEIFTEKNIKINKKEIDKIIKNFTKLFKINKNNYLSIAFVSPSAIRKMNKQYRGIDKATDVLSFEGSQKHKNTKTQKQFFASQDFLGEIVICYQKACSQAKENKNTITKEINQLLAHGLVHLMGYGHKTGKEEEKMKVKEKEILKFS